jgi:hypothetical protein
MHQLLLGKLGEDDDKYSRNQPFLLEFRWREFANDWAHSGQYAYQKDCLSREDLISCTHTSLLIGRYASPWTAIYNNTLEMIRKLQCNEKEAT